jgi:hypothetical protein
MTDSNDRANDPLHKLLKDEGPVDPDKALQQRAQALQSLRAALIRGERLTFAVSSLGVMVFAFAWGQFMTTPDVRVMLFCMLLMMWGLSIQIIFILIHAIRNARASILKEIKLQRLEQVTGAFSADIGDYWGRDLSLRVSRTERWAWCVAIVVLALIAGAIGTTSAIIWQ